jgi:7SK snRNA methylphosphate capping enzyme
MSVAKWIHLNYGDEGLQKVFKKIFDSLTPNGVFIMEPQPWKSYKKKRNLTEVIYLAYL